MDRLRALCAVAQYGSIVGAAQALHLTPSGVSQQLSKLEREVGVALLLPAGRGVQLTDAGRLLARRGQDVMSLLASAESEVASLSCDVVGELRMGAFVSASRRVVPAAIAHLTQQYPDLRVTFVAGDAEELLPAIEDRDLDLALVDSWAPLQLSLPDGVEQEMVHCDTADVAPPSHHPLAERRFISLDEVAQMPWATWKRGDIFDTWLVQTLRAQGTEPRIRYQVPEVAAQLAFVAQGLAAALIPRLARAVDPENVSFIPVRPALQREIYAVSRRDNDRPSVRTGIRAIKDAFAAIQIG